MLSIPFLSHSSYFPIPFHFSISQKTITSVAVNPTGEWLAFGCANIGQLLVWEWQSETYILKQQGHYYDMNILAYSPDGNYIATGGDDAKVVNCLPCPMVPYLFLQATQSTPWVLPIVSSFPLACFYFIF